MQLKPENIPYMTKTLLTILFATTLMLGNPLTSRANAALETIDNDFQNVVISVSESTIHVSGGAGQMLAIYDLAGVRVGLPKGCYIVKVGKVVRKIAVR